MNGKFTPKEITQTGDEQVLNVIYLTVMALKDYAQGKISMKTEPSASYIQNL
jgi:hypothetical protein